MKPERIVLLTLIVAAAGGAVIISELGAPTGSDVNFHMKLAKAWLENKNPLIEQEYYHFGSPYPPGFHIVLAVFFLIFPPQATVNLLQVLLPPAILFSTYYLVKTYADRYTGALSICFLLSSIAFWDRGFQVIPQAVDVLLFPVLIHFFFKERSRPFAILGTFLIYNHGLYTALLIASLLVYSAKEDRNKLPLFLPIAILSLPLFLIEYHYGFSVISSNIGKTTSSQMLFYVIYPLFGLAYLGYFLSIATIAALFHFAKKDRTSFENILILWVLVMLPIYPFFPDRFMSYAAQPFSIMSAITMKDYLKDETRKNAFLILSFILCIMFSLVFLNKTQILDLDLLDPLTRILFNSYRIIS